MPFKKLARTKASRSSSRDGGFKAQDAISPYIDEIRLTFDDASGKVAVKKFLDVVYLLKTSEIDSLTAMRRMNKLFRGRNHLLVRFNVFLPPEFHFIKYPHVENGLSENADVEEGANEEQMDSSGTSGQGFNERSPQSIATTPTLYNHIGHPQPIAASALCNHDRHPQSVATSTLCNHGGHPQPVGHIEKCKKTRKFHKDNCKAKSVDQRIEAMKTKHSEEIQKLKEEHKAQMEDLQTNQEDCAVEMISEYEEQLYQVRKELNEQKRLHLRMLKSYALASSATVKRVTDRAKIDFSTV